MTFTLRKFLIGIATLATAISTNCADRATNTSRAASVADSAAMSRPSVAQSRGRENIRVKIVFDSSDAHFVNNVVSAEVQGSDTLWAGTAYNPESIAQAITWGLGGGVSHRAPALGATPQSFKSDGLVMLDDKPVPAAVINSLSIREISRVEVIRSASVQSKYADTLARRGVTLVWTVAK